MDSDEIYKIIGYIVAVIFFIYLISKAFSLNVRVIEGMTSNDKQSNIKNSGRGVFSTRAYTIGEIIEVCPCIKQEYKYAKGEISKYVYDYNQKYCIIALGFCSIYNHKDDPNAKWTIINTEQIKIVALKNIRQGEEIFISYGSDYFKNHGITMK